MRVLSIGMRIIPRRIVIVIMVLTYFVRYMNLIMLFAMALAKTQSVRQNRVSKKLNARRSTKQLEVFISNAMVISMQRYVI